MNTHYPSDLTEAQWTCLRRHLPLATALRRRRHPLRRVFDAIFYLLRTGCQWRGCPLGSMLVDTLGLPISISVTSAGVHDKVGAWRLLAGLKPLVPRLAKLWADGAYTSAKLARWCKDYGGWELEIVGRDAEARGCAVQPRRWVVEPGALWAVFARLVRNRRLRIDDERKVQTSKTLIEVAFIRLLLRRLAKRCITIPKHAHRKVRDSGAVARTSQ